MYGVCRLINIFSIQVLLDETLLTEVSYYIRYDTIKLKISL